MFFALLLLATAHTWRPGDHRKVRVRVMVRVRVTVTVTVRVRVRVS